MRPLPPLILRLLRPIRRFTLKEPKPAAEAPTVPTQKFFAAFEAVSTAGLSPACIGVSIFVEGPTKCAGSSRCPPIHAQHYGALRGHSRLPPVAPSRQRAWPNTRGLGEARSEKCKCGRGNYWKFPAFPRPWSSAETIAAALNVKLDHIRRKRRLLDGICADAAALLEDKHVSINAFDTLKKMGSERQVEVAHNMVAMNKFTISYAKTLLANTPNSQLAAGRRRIKPRG